MRQEKRCGLLNECYEVIHLGLLRLVAIDLDDTLLYPDRTISPRAKRAIGAVQRLGSQVVLATGRMFCAAKPFALELELTGPLIAYQGALVKTVAEENIWRHLHIPAGQLVQLLEWLEAEPVHINLYVDDQLYVEQMNSTAERYAKYSRVEVKEVGRLSLLPFEAATKVVAIGDPDRLSDLQIRSQALFGPALAINRSYPHFLEFGHLEATKSQALAWLGEKLGIGPAAMMAIGDGENDLDMIEYAGIGVAMGNAPAVIQAAADFVTATNDADGVAIALEKYFNLTP